MHVLFKIHIQILNTYIVWCKQFQVSSSGVGHSGTIMEIFTVCINFPCSISMKGLYVENTDLLSEDC